MEEQKQATPATHIAPSVGRVVWYWPGESDVTKMDHDGIQPLRADICYVTPHGTVNLSVNDASGMSHARQGIQLHQGDAEGCSLPRPFATWMPYQKQVAAKAEAAEKAEATNFQSEHERLSLAMLAEQVRQLRLQNDAQEMANEQRRRETGASRIDAKLAGNLASAIC